MAIQYFHCTDGHDLILDRSGREARSADAAMWAAREVAAEVMRAVPGHDDWAGWAVHVYDDFGALAIVSFVPERAAASGAGAAVSPLETRIR